MDELRPPSLIVGDSEDVVDERSRETNAAVSLLLSSFSSDGKGNSDLNNQSYSGEDDTTELFSLIVDDSEQEEDEQSSESSSIVSFSSPISNDSEEGLVSNGQLHFEAEDATELIRELKHAASTIAMTLKTNLRLFSLENDGSSCTTTKVAPANTATANDKAHVKTESQSITTSSFRKCGTIESALATISPKCKLYPDAEWVTQNVYSAPECFYDRIIRLSRHPTDTIVTRFCYSLARTQDNLRTAVSATSIARSQKVAEVNHVLYAELDRIMDLLAVPSDDAIRSWKQDAGDIDKRVLGFGDATSVRSSCPGGTTTKTDAVTLTHYDSQNALSSTRSSDNMRDQSGRLVVTDSSPKWYLALRDITFRASDAIGEGAFGKVCKGTWLDTPVVVKFMGYEEDPGTVSTKLLLHEIWVWHQLSHSHIIQLFGANHIGKRYFVCEYASNGSLLAYLRKREDNIQEKWRELFEVALGVQHMHSLDIVHNDLKCDNILVGERGDTKIIDFSLSCIPGIAEIQVDPKRMSAVHWKSPEYLKGERPAIATDIYSLGMCILEVMIDDIP